MIVKPARAAITNRQPSVGQRPTQRRDEAAPSAQVVSFPAPTRGLVLNAPATAQPEGSCSHLENWWPGEEGPELRGGAVIRWTLGSTAVRALFAYRAGAVVTRFAADAAAIYRLDAAASPSTPVTPAVSGLTSGEWSTVNAATDGGSFLVAVNGADAMRIYDGSAWQAVTASSTPFALTGVDGSALSDVWAHRNRLFFIEAGTLSAWYLGVNSVAGAATELPLRGLFQRGGSLLFGSTWSSDSGAGIDDRCVFVTDQGEVAVYTGGNPGDAADWTLTGVFEIDEPLDKAAFVRIGGDVLIATKGGVVAMSAVVQKDQAQLRLASLSSAIDPLWRAALALGGESTAGWRMVRWPERGLILVAPAAGDQMFAAGASTGAWAAITGWGARSLAAIDGALLFGDAQGRVFEGDSGGTDDGAPFVGRLCFAFSGFGSQAAVKTASALRVVYRTSALAFTRQHGVAADYNVEFMSAPAVGAAQPSGDGSAWDVSAWDVSSWGGAAATMRTVAGWSGVAAHGRALAPKIQVVSAQAEKIALTVAGADLVLQTGGPIA